MKRWLFPRAEGIVVDSKTGRWSSGAFFEEAEPTWYPAQPALESEQGRHGLVLWARNEARRQIRSLRADKQR